MKSLAQEAEVQIQVTKVPGRHETQVAVEADCAESFLDAIMVLVERFAMSQGLTNEMALALLASRMLCK